MEVPKKSVIFEKRLVLLIFNFNIKTNGLW